MQQEYGYRSGQLLVIFDSTETGDKQWQWLVQDHLGSTRMVADRSGSLAGIRRHDYLPFGEEIPAGVGYRTAANGYASDQVRQKFGSKERDTETGLDYFGSRYFSSSQGRFTSVDPVKLTPVRLLDPQRFNLYAYVRNNPLKFVDPEGKDVFLANDTEEGRRKALLNITKNLTASEQRNIGYRKNADGKYELYIKDPSKIDPSKASAGYGQLTNRIGNHDLKINFTLLGRGQTVTGQAGEKISHQELISGSHGGGRTTFYGNGNIDVVVPEGGRPAGVMGLTASGKDVQITFPDFIITAHELFGETYKYTPEGAKAGLQGQDKIIDDSNAVIKIENEIRQFHGLPLRSGKDHGFIQMEMEIKAKPE